MWSRLPVAAPLAAAALALPQAAPAQTTVPPGFQETIAINGLSNPIAVDFSADGRVFVAEQNGRIKVYDSVADSSPTIFADLSAKVHNFWDRGLLGLALAPDFPADPSVYVLTRTTPLSAARRRAGAPVRCPTNVPRRPARPPTAASCRDASRASPPTAT